MFVHWFLRKLVYGMKNGHRKMSIFHAIFVMLKVDIKIDWE